MRKFFAVLIVGFLMIPQAEAFVYRSQPSYSFRASIKKNPSRFARSRWRGTSSRYNFRYSKNFKRSDYQRWNELEVTAAETEKSGPPEQVFCNFFGSIIGNYLPQKEVSKRCCVCFDGWKCQRLGVSKYARNSTCDPNWATDMGYVPGSPNYRGETMLNKSRLR